MIGNLTGMHMIVIVVIILLLFGAPKLPALAKSLGQSMKILKKEVSDDGPATQPTQPGLDSDRPELLDPQDLPGEKR